MGMHTADAAPVYALGHSEQELARLERQGEIFAAETREVLSRAGLASGMAVLDVGCGVGDVSLVAAEIVGPTGSVLGIDRATSALPLAEARAGRYGYNWLAFREGNLYTFRPERTFDAVVGRFILMHVADPVGAIRRLGGFMNSGGAIAFLEMDIDQAGAIPEIPLLRQCIGWITATYRRVGAEPNMGSQLYSTYRAAGLSPSLTGMTRIASADDMAVFAFAAQTLASLMPKIEEYGVATAGEIDVPTLAERLHLAAVAGDHCILMPRLIGAWARLP
jgi:ubiquinone/menaquinone biosynthesis C-methylase UbiE